MNIDSDEFINALYRSILGRAPDSLGFEQHDRNLANGISLTEIIQIFLESDEFKKKLSVLLTIAQTEGKIPAINGFSQYQEDWFLVRDILIDSAQQNYIVDVGANSITGSNTWWFTQNLGFRTLLIEANPELCKEFAKTLPSHAKILNLAIGTSEGLSKFYLSENNAVSSLSKDNAEIWGKPIREISVEMRRLPSILEEQEIPLNFLLLSIDIEGWDLRVLKDLLENSPYRPQYIVAELPEFNDRFLIENLPELVLNYEVLARTVSNVILRIRHRS